jgi:hypothetical protein
MGIKRACPPWFFVLAEDLGRSLSKFYKAFSQMGEVTGLQQLIIPFCPWKPLGHPILRSLKQLSDRTRPGTPVLAGVSSRRVGRKLGGIRGTIAGFHKMCYSESTKKRF